MAFQIHLHLGYAQASWSEEVRFHMMSRDGNQPNDSPLQEFAAQKRKRKESYNEVGGITHSRVSVLLSCHVWSCLKSPSSTLAQPVHRLPRPYNNRLPQWSSRAPASYHNHHHHHNNIKSIISHHFLTVSNSYLFPFRSTPLYLLFFFPTIITSGCLFHLALQLL